MADIFAKYHQMIFKGIGYTMLVSIIGTIIGLVIGLLIGVFRTMPTPKNKFLRVLKKLPTGYFRLTSKYSAARR